MAFSEISIFEEINSMFNLNFGLICNVAAISAASTQSIY